jgi:hypothetical protein
VTRRPASTVRVFFFKLFPAAGMHVMVKDRLAARKQQRNLFAPIRSGVLGNEGPTFLNVELAGLGSVQELLRASPNNSFIRDYAFECLGKT